jgi:hypothetical protein
MAEAAPTFAFAASMLAALEKWGALTANQLAASERCLAGRTRAQAERQIREETAPAVDCSKIEAAFAAAKASGLRKLRLDLDVFRFKPAKESGRNAGSIYVTEGETYLGRITNGRFVCTRECGEDRETRVVFVAGDPEAAAVAHGKSTSRCSCCGLELTDPVSIERGIGPICASRYGW